MPIDNDDNALAVLEEVRAKKYPKLSKKLLKRCYEAEKRLQYERDRDQALLLVRRAVEEELQNEFENRA